MAGPLTPPYPGSAGGTSSGNSRSAAGGFSRAPWKACPHFTFPALLPAQSRKQNQAFYCCPPGPERLVSSLGSPSRPHTHTPPRSIFRSGWRLWPDGRAWGRESGQQRLLWAGLWGGGRRGCETYLGVVLKQNPKSGL